MNTPYGPPVSERPPQWGPPPPGHGYPRTYSGDFGSPHPSGGYPVRDPNQPHGRPHPPQPGHDQPGSPYPQRPSAPYERPGPPPKKSMPPWILSAAGGAAVVAGVLVLGFVTPGFFTTTFFDREAVQEGVRGVLFQDYGQNVQTVTCPADQKVQAGSTFICRATIDGAQRNVTITVKSDTGDYEVARPS